MENMSYIIFICITVPMLFLLPIIRDRFARVIVGYMICGLFCCLLVSEINGILLNLFGNDYVYVTTTITPISEEIVKALPVLFFAFVVSDSREKLVAIGFAAGIGFAILENMVILLQNVSSVSLFWALIRGCQYPFLRGSSIKSTSVSSSGEGVTYMPPEMSKPISRSSSALYGSAGEKCPISPLL